MKLAGRSYLIVLGIEAPWVRSLFSVLPGIREGRRFVYAPNVRSLGYLLSSSGLKFKISNKPKTKGLTEKDVLVPGWTRFEGLSTWLLARSLRKTIRRWGRPEAIVYTLPQYAGVAEQFQDFCQAYYAYDPYRFYHGWGTKRIDGLEKRILDACSVAFGISRQLVEDLQQRTATRVHYSPNAVSTSFVEALRHVNEKSPVEFEQIVGKMVGCIGQIYPSAYDWDLLEGLSTNFPEVTFVFIGGFTAEAGEHRVRVENFFARSNVRWLGRKPHIELPHYLNRFDVCLSPLAVTQHNQRRSLLRLYDYLATDKPVLSTALREAAEHHGHIQVSQTLSDAVSALRQMLNAGVSASRLAEREQYIRQNTWEVRAEALWRVLSPLSQ